ncbi:MAG TPA: hypothetical protein VM367_05175 [Pseudonocardia sp.]|nr:hypothetical protein [Pseudonocardia sp.]
MPDAADPPPMRLGVARARWRAAEDRLYPVALADPASYQRGLQAVQAVLTELRRRTGEVEALLAVEAAAEEIVAAACPGGPPLPADLLVAVACGLRDRELAGEAADRRRRETIDAARAAGRAWAVLDGPPTPAELAGGRQVLLHLDSQTVLEATVDPWSGGEPFGLGLTRPGGGTESSSTGDRAAWLAAHERLRAEVERAGEQPATEDRP